MDPNEFAESEFANSADPYPGMNAVEHTMYEASDNVRVVKKVESGRDIILEVRDDALDEVVREFDPQEQVNAELFADGYAEGRYIRSL